MTKLGGPEVLRLAERPDPEPGPGQVIVRVRAANVNPFSRYFIAPRRAMAGISSCRSAPRAWYANDA